MLTRSIAALLVICAASSAEAPKTPNLLKARLGAKMAGDVSLSDRKIPLTLTFTSRTDGEQKFQNGEYRVALLVPTVVRTITIKGTVTDKPDLSLADGKLKPGEEYYLVVTLRNLTALAKFKTTK